MHNDQWIRLKNGDKIRLRHILFTDVNDRHEFFVKLSMAQTGIVHTIDEIEIHTHDTQEQIYDFLRNHRGYWLLALNPQKKIVGEIDITIKNLLRVKHNGFLTMGILPEYQNQGLGTIMLEHAFSWAVAHNLLRIELSVFQSNIRAYALYEKFGFVVEGKRKNFLRLDDGSFDNDLIMAKYFS